MLEEARDWCFVMPTLGITYATLYEAGGWGITEEIATGLGMKRELEIAIDNPDMIGLASGLLRLDRVRQHDTVSENQGRLCHAELRAGTKRVAIEYDIVWQAPGGRQFIVDLRLRGD